MSKILPVRLLRERALSPTDAPATPSKRAVAARPARSVTVNLAESPLGWLYSRGLLTRVQFQAGERLRSDWERAQLAPNVTMSWDAAPIARAAAALPRAWTSPPPSSTRASASMPPW